ncbi:hypothetical protein I6F35_33670 [Bradyrhizobium sp. BRP22]|uniref:hypothetical protein n=1 Tax=Bradyrhizobium sp. BRP22 TaxID=2793821 RepID=UPI001CD5054D|nr:hypothetical protein [Bradyrhizobium sp. BRP22]MCA1458085.1 hypothetical protein [Bradyrhizobium sp. BRP22]
MTSVPSNAIATGQPNVSTSATPIAPARPDRKRLTIINGGTADVFIGGPNVTAANGALLAGTKGQSIVLETAAAVYGIVGADTAAVSFIEEFA